MQIKYSPIHLFASVENQPFKRKIFDPTRDDIERICRFFPIGKLLHYEKEKGINFSHANFFVFVATTRGQYALKFYPPHEAKMIAIEYAINRVLVIHHFLTPVMYADVRGQAFVASNDLLATCYSYIEGLGAWEHIKQPNTIRQINAAVLSLKNILSTDMGHIPFLKQADLVRTINTLTQVSYAMSPYTYKKTITATLLDAYRTYQHHQRLFTRQWVHNNITLTNFLIYKKTVYILDLTHIQEDYALSDLASLVISCLSYDIPTETIKIIVKDYFSRHKMDPEYLLVLNTLIKIKLVRKYLDDILNEESADLSLYPPNLIRTYISHRSARKKSFTALLKKMNDNPKFII